jgi:hypothetical protein
LRFLTMLLRDNENPPNQVVRKCLCRVFIPGYNAGAM